MGAGVATSLLVTGCGGGSEVSKPEPQTIEYTGYFTGRSADGVGASADMAGFDAVATLVDRALVGREPPRALVIVAVVNNSAAAITRPRFSAEIVAGGIRPLRTARSVLVDRTDRDARRAVRALGRTPTSIRPATSRPLYLVVDGARREQVVSLRMNVDGEITTLAPRQR